MNEKNKKRLMIGIIIALAVIILYLLYLHPDVLSNMFSAGGNAGSCGSNPPTQSNYVTGQCTDGGKYTCTTTCTNTPTPTTPTTPNDERTCSQYASSNGYTHFSYMTSFTSDESCRSYAYSGSTIAQCYPTNLKLVGNCCLWNC